MFDYNELMFKFVILLFIPYFCFADTCLDWFKESKISETDKSCVSKCSTLQMDMSTFSCSQNCQKFCNAQCEPDSFWKSKIKDGRPKNWEEVAEKSVEWSGSEKFLIAKILSELPDDLKNLPLAGIYRMKKSSQIVNPGTTSSNGDSIALYDRAFDNPNWTTESVLIHELGHVKYISLSLNERKSYENKLGWRVTVNGIASRSEEFISSRSKDSSNEDFAENFSFFLLDPDKLKSKVPRAYEWMQNKYKNTFKIKRGCE